MGMISEGAVGVDMDGIGLGTKRNEYLQTNMLVNTI
jgi:hypothetical protein